MGFLEDISSWIAYYIVRPAVNLTIKKLGAQHFAWITFMGLKLRIFLAWVTRLDTTLAGWIRQEIVKELAYAVSGYSNLVSILNKKVKDVIKQVEGLLDHVRLFASRVISVTILWWTVERAKLLKLMRDSYIRILEFEKEAIKVILDWWKDTWTMVVNHVKAQLDLLGVELDLDLNLLIKQLDTSVDTVLKHLDVQIHNVTLIIDNQIKSVQIWFEAMDKQAREWMEGQIDEVIKLYRKEVPSIVEGLFGWAMPVIQPIIDAVGWLETIAEIVTGKAPKEQDIIDAENETKEIQEKIDGILDEIG